MWSRSRLGQDGLGKCEIVQTRDQAVLLFWENPRLGPGPLSLVLSRLGPNRSRTELPQHYCKEDFMAAHSRWHWMAVMRQLSSCSWRRTWTSMHQEDVSSIKLCFILVYAPLEIQLTWMYMRQHRSEVDVKNVADDLTMVVIFLKSDACEVSAEVLQLWLVLFILSVSVCRDSLSWFCFFWSSAMRIENSTALSASKG